MPALDAPPARKVNSFEEGHDEFWRKRGLSPSMAEREGRTPEELIAAAKRKRELRALGRTEEAQERKMMKEVSLIDQIAWENACARARETGEPLPPRPTARPREEAPAPAPAPTPARSMHVHTAPQPPSAVHPPVPKPMPSTEPTPTPAAPPAAPSPAPPKGGRRTHTTVITKRLPEAERKAEAQALRELAASRGLNGTQIGVALGYGPTWSSCAFTGSPYCEGPQQKIRAYLEALPEVPLGHKQVKVVIKDEVTPPTPPSKTEEVKVVPLPAKDGSVLNGVSPQVVLKGNPEFANPELAKAIKQTIVNEQRPGGVFYERGRFTNADFQPVAEWAGAEKKEGPNLTAYLIEQRKHDLTFVEQLCSELLESLEPSRSGIVVLQIWARTQLAK